MPIIKDINFEYRKTNSSKGLGWIIPSGEKYLCYNKAVDMLCVKNLELFEFYNCKKIKKNLGC